MTQLRRYTFKLYPSRWQAEALERHRRLHCDLYNACLAQRIEQWRRECQRHGAGERRGLTGYDQAGEIAAIRREVDWGAEIGATCLAATIQRVDKAYKAFFARRKKGAESWGFPRFKRWEDYPGFSCFNPRSKPTKSGELRWNGWRWTQGEGRQSRVAIMGIPGAIKARGELPQKPQAVIGADFVWRAGTWWMSLIVEMAPRMAAADYLSGEVKFDLIDSFATVRVVDGGLAAGPEETVFAAADGRIGSQNQGVNATSAPDAQDLGPDQGGLSRATLEKLAPDAPKLGPDQGPIGREHNSEQAPDTPNLGADQGPLPVGMIINRGPDTPNLGGIQRRMARCKRGSFKYRQLKRRLARRKMRDARRRREHLHEWTTALARRFAALKIIAPRVREVTQSGRGDARDWGAAVDIKAAVNRHILDQAPATAIAMLEYKLAERGGLTEMVEDPAPSAVIGNQIVAATKATRRLKRSARV